MTKRIADPFCAALLLVFFAPVFILAALAIKLDSRGPVFFRQDRFGLDGRVIRIWKFRTLLHTRADPAAENLVTRDDPRVSRIGAVLRRASLDELPQLFNVLSGDMSLVGPRPHPLRAKAAGVLYTQLSSSYHQRHRMRPGITGLAQVLGWRGETDTVDKLNMRLHFDNEYIDNWSLWLDVKILVLTLREMLVGRNAY